MYNHQDLEYFYLGSEDNWIVEPATYQPSGAYATAPTNGHSSALASAQALARAASLAQHKNRVLILEDFDAIRAMLSDHFKRQGFDVQSAATLAGALAMSREKAPNVLFVDYDLSSEDPYRVIEQLRTSFPSCTIVLMGGPLSADDQTRAIHAGASSIMKKAYDLLAMDQLAATDEAVLQPYLTTNPS